MSGEFTSSIESIESASIQLEQLLDQLADLADDSLSQSEFFAQLKSLVEAELPILGLGVWEKNQQDRLTLLIDENSNSIYQSAEAYQHDQQSLEAVCRPDSRPLVIQNLASQEDDHVMFAAPIICGEVAWGMIVFYHKRTLPQNAHGGYLKLVHAIAEIMNHFLEQQRLRNYDQQQHHWNNHLKFVQTIHQDLDEKKTAYRIANQARTTLAVDRVSVATYQGATCQVMAISGIDTINRRANVVKKLERLIQVVIKQEEALIYSGELDHLAPQVEQRLVDYLEESPCKSLMILPLQISTSLNSEQHELLENKLESPFGVLVIEQLTTTNQLADATQSEEIVHQSSLALHNARNYAQIPFRPVWKMLASLLALFAWQRLSTTLKFLLPISALILATFFIQIDFDIEVQGRLVPQVERRIFAPADAVVEKIFIKHGKYVEAGETLLKLHSSEFQLKITEISGQLNQAMTELEKIQIERTQNRFDPSRSETYENRRDQTDQLSAKEIQLKEKIENLNKQLAILRQSDLELTLTSPIAGQVLSWNVDQSLQVRPVQRGQALLKVADVEGDWQLEFELPDKSSLHVKQAQKQTKEDLDLTFQLMNEPGNYYQAKLLKLGKSVDANRQQTEPVIKLVAQFNQDEIDHLHPGLTASGKIHCGKASIAYVWSYQLIESVRRRFFW